jgi:predicted nucleotidyltransferase component of viral defense system
MTLLIGVQQVNLFDKIVEQALITNPEFTPLRIVVEKEILHHDILRVMSEGGLLKQLTFMGGTCLRNCYDSQRLSEDLDFAGGTGFDKLEMKNLKELLTDAIYKKYEMSVDVSEPLKDLVNTDTWKIKIITRPERKSFPAQRINIDICRLPSYESMPYMLKNYYGIEMGTSGLILNIESQDEILADKIVALALCPNRVKNRDIWDIIWMNQNNINLNPELVYKKLDDRNFDKKAFSVKLENRLNSIKNGHKEFLFEMKRFLPSKIINETLEKQDYWIYVVRELSEICKEFLG